MLLELLLACADTPAEPVPGGYVAVTGCAETLWHHDVDGDGFGGAHETECATDAPGQGWWRDGSDCDDADPLTNPVAAERCNGLDDNCDGIVDVESCEDSLGLAEQRVFGAVDDGADIGNVFCLPGDLDGDGIADLAVGDAGGGEDNGGRVILVPLQEGDVSVAAGTEVIGHKGWWLGMSLVPTGDDVGMWVVGRGEISLWRDASGTSAAHASVDGERLDDEGGVAANTADLLVGTPSGIGGALFFAGAVDAGTFDASDATVEVVGNRRRTGSAVALGDVDADGQDDLVVVAEGGDATLAYVYIVLGGATGTVDVLDADTVLDGGAVTRQLVRAVVGDLDGDGREDLVVGEIESSDTRLRVVSGPTPGAFALEVAAVATISVGISGASTPVVGDAALYFGVAEPDAGVVYRFDGALAGALGLGDANETWRGETVADRAGAALALGGGLLAVGASAHSEPGYGDGAIYIVGI